MNANQLIGVLGDFRPSGYNNVREFFMQCRRYKGHKHIADSIRKKRIPKAKDCICVDCGKQAYCYDHRDYTKPTEIEPVCGRCQGLRGAGLPYPLETEELVELYKYELERFLKKRILSNRSTQEEKLECEVYLGFVIQFINSGVKNEG